MDRFNYNRFIIFIAIVNFHKFKTFLINSVGEVTLKDFKELIQITKSDKNSWKNFNFVFKSLDPELGTVKQEVCSFL